MPPPKYWYGGTRNPWWRPREDLDLIEKARVHNETLTDDERERLVNLPELDDPLIGRALAYPHTITASQRRQVLAWPAEDVVAANIAKVTDGGMTFDEFVGRAASDITFLNFDRAALIKNHYHEPPERDEEGSAESDAARQLLSTKEQTQAWMNAVLSGTGRGVAERMLQLEAGMLTQEEAVKEQQMHADATARLERAIWRMERKEQTLGLADLRPRSDIDLYLRYYLSKRNDWFLKVTEEGRHYGYAIYRTREIRERHPEAEARFKRETKYLEGGTLLFDMLKAQSPCPIDDAPVLDAPFAGVLLCSYNREIPITFEFYWEYYLATMLSMDGNSPAWAFHRARSDEAKAAMRFVRCQALEFEASELNINSFRENFRGVRKTSVLKEGIHSRYFLVCTTEGTPELVKILKQNTRYLVWVVDGDWKAPEGKDVDEDGYQGKIKVTFGWMLFYDLAEKLWNKDYDLKEAWREMEDNHWEVRY